MAYRMKKASQLRLMNNQELRERLKEIAATQMLLRSRKKIVFNPGQWRNIKKEKARILTILGERKNRRDEYGKKETMPKL